MRSDYQSWLEKQGYDSGTVTAQLHRVGRVEKYHGDLDKHFAQDRLDALPNLLKYSSDDERQRRPNPSRIPIDGNLRNNLASYRFAIVLYGKFLRDNSTEPFAEPDNTSASLEDVTESVPEALRLGLERDLQAALRRDIVSLEAGLEIIDRGVERSVPSGRIDITAHGQDGALVVIELKAGMAGQQAIGQILSYMGDMSEIDDSRPIRGILVAFGFDGKAVAAARMIPNLQLKQYSIRFSFSEVAC